MALSHKKKTAGRPLDWPEETDSDAEWEQWACNEVIWEEMINADATAMDTYSEEATLNTEKTSEEDTLDAVSKVGEETQMPELLDDWTEDDSMDEIEEGISKITFTGTEGGTEITERGRKKLLDSRKWSILWLQVTT